jgi:hypothetical protein
MTRTRLASAAILISATPLAVVYAYSPGVVLGSNQPVPASLHPNLAFKATAWTTLEEQRAHRRGPALGPLRVGAQRGPATSM